MSAAVATATADCPDCAGHLTCTASGRGDGHTARCVLRCDDCNSEWLLTATLTRIGPPPRDNIKIVPVPVQPVWNGDNRPARTATVEEADARTRVRREGRAPGRDEHATVTA